MGRRFDTISTVWLIAEEQAIFQEKTCHTSFLLKRCMTGFHRLFSTARPGRGMSSMVSDLYEDLA